MEQAELITPAKAPVSFFAYYHSPLGELQISSTKAFITSVLFVDAEKHIDFIDAKQEESKDLPEITIQCIKQLDEYFSGKRKKFDLPITHSGSDFQKKIWNELQRISYGKTISYLDLAKRIGNPKSIRAVGAANGKNKISIIVPCHRVIGSNGSLVGYGGGMKNKQWLLEHEAKHGNGVQELF